MRNRDAPLVPWPVTLASQPVAFVFAVVHADKAPLSLEVAYFVVASIHAEAGTVVASTHGAFEFQAHIVAEILDAFTVSYAVPKRSYVGSTCQSVESTSAVHHVCRPLAHILASICPHPNADSVPLAIWIRHLSVCGWITHHPPELAFVVAAITVGQLSVPKDESVGERALIQVAMRIPVEVWVGIRQE